MRLIVFFCALYGDVAVEEEEAENNACLFNVNGTTANFCTTGICFGFIRNFANDFRSTD